MVVLQLVRAQAEEHYLLKDYRTEGMYGAIFDLHLGFSWQDSSIEGLLRRKLLRG